MKRLVAYNITESDMEWTLLYTRDSVHDAFRPLAAELALRYHSSDSRPYCVAIGGPPGCGKSAVAAVLKRLISGAGVTTKVLPLDGFHLKNEELRSKMKQLDGKQVPLLSIKGAKETYDAERLTLSLELLKQGKRFFWPLYSRNLHEPVSRGVLIDGSEVLYIVEGNYLLIDREPWRNIMKFFDTSVFIRSRKRFLRTRIMRRKMRGGYSHHDSRAHYVLSDRQNILEVLQYSKGYDYLLDQVGKNRYRLVTVSESESGRI